MTSTPTFYEVLDLPEDLRHERNLPTHTLRMVYRRALLQNHPDKSDKSTLIPNKKTYTIDQISEAFNTLSDSKARAKYDKELKLRKATANGGQNGKQVFRTGIEIVDLDDLEMDEAQGTWYRSCRCGDERGFLIKETDLEEVADEGEICVGCRGCSLWLKVLFGVIDEAAQDKDNALRVSGT